MKKLIPIVTVALLAASAASLHGSIVTKGTWATSNVTFSWLVENPDADAWWTYQYCWSNDTGPSISHLTIEVTPDAPLSHFKNFEISTDGGATWVTPADNSVLVEKHKAGTQANPDMPEDMWGIKFEDPNYFGQDGIETLCIRFDAMRSPVPGDFYAKAGGNNNLAGAYNDGFGFDPSSGVLFAGTLPDGSQQPQYILRPNGVIPEPSTIVIWSLLMGLTWAGGAWRMFYRKRRQ